MQASCQFLMLSLPALLSCAAPPPIRSRSFGKDGSCFALDAPSQVQKSQVTAFPLAMPPPTDLFYILFQRDIKLADTLQVDVKFLGAIIQIQTTSLPSKHFLPIFLFFARDS